MKLFTKAFWLGALVRALKTAGQVVIPLAAVGGILDWDWKAMGSVAGGAIVLSLLTSLSSLDSVAAPTSPAESPMYSEPEPVDSVGVDGEVVDDPETDATPAENAIPEGV